ncbi:MAG: phosphodiesterase [Kiloniellales bacterium]
MIIAQVTDTHIKADGKLAYQRVDTAAALRRCVAHLNALVPRPDAALLTGDLVDLGRPAEYAVLREILAELAMPYYVIPGNHDDRENLRAAFADHDYLPREGEFLHYVIEDYPVRLIGLDTTVPGAPHGELCAERLSWLDARLAEDRTRQTVLFMHHPPFLTGIAHMDAQNCRNGTALGALVERHCQIAFVLCGHVHRTIQRSWHGTAAAIGPSPAHAVALDLRADGPSAFVLEPPSCLLLFQAGDGGLVAHVSLLGRFDGPYPFYDSAGRLID